VLNSSLHIYTHNHTSQTINLEVGLEPKNESERFLNLADSLEHIWTSHENLWNCSEVYCILGPNASFTDSRILFIWLQSRLLFDNGQFYMHNAQVALDFDRFTYREICEYLLPIKQKHSQELLYSSEPRIGRK
jgi:hypothetical protein